MEEFGGDNDGGGYWGRRVVAGWEGGVCDLGLLHCCLGQTEMNSTLDPRLFTILPDITPNSTLCFKLGWDSATGD